MVRERCVEPGEKVPISEDYSLADIPSPLQLIQRLISDMECQLV